MAAATMWAHVLNAVLAAWLVAAPAVLAYGDPLRANDRVVGPIAAACALVAAWETTRALRHADVLLGAWLVVVPWVLAGGTAATANSVAVGVAMITLALVGRRVRGRFGGGWTMLVRR